MWAAAGTTEAAGLGWPLPAALDDCALDRVLHHAITINTRGDSYRLKDKLKAGLIRADEPAVN